MKLFFISIFLLVSSISATLSSQEKNPSFLEQFSVEVGSGYHIPFSPSKDITTQDYAGINGFYLGAAYGITDAWGIRMTYSNNTFANKNDKSIKLTIQKVMAEATFKILQSIRSEETPFEIVAHTGLGVSLGKGAFLSDTDKMANVQFGLMPVYQITNNISILLDVSYILNFRQNQGYDGQYVYKDIRDVTGSYLQSSIGIGLRF